MNILPKFSFLFQCVPIFIPKSFFQKLDRTLLGFIWDKKIPRIRKIYLQRPKRLGGMALPNFIFYYWAANSQILHYWLLVVGMSDAPAWLRLEAASCMPSSLAALIYNPRGLPDPVFCRNTLVKSTFKIWTQLKCHFGLQTLSLQAPISRNPFFSPSMADGAFAVWSNLGIKSFNNLYIEGTFASFQQLSSKFKIPNSHFFRYLQIRSFVRDSTPQFPSQPGSHGVDTLLLPPPSSKGVISCMYGRILSLHGSSLSALKSLWELDIAQVIDDDSWDEILSRVHSSSMCQAWANTM